MNLLYVFTAKQLETLKKFVDSLYDIQIRLNADIALPDTPNINRELLNELMQDSSLDEGELEKRMESLCEDAMANALDVFDVDAINEMHESVAGMERELKYLSEVIESKSQKIEDLVIVLNTLEFLPAEMEDYMSKAEDLDDIKDEIYKFTDNFLQNDIKKLKSFIERVSA